MPAPVELRPAYLLAGPTASGKSAAAQILARGLGAAILSADSMLVYRGMDIGTAKPTAAERAEIATGGVDLVGPEEEFSAGAWLRAAGEFIRALPPAQPLVVVGGTGLYFTALLSGLDRPVPDPARLAAAAALIAEKGTAAAYAEFRRRHPGATLGDPENPRRLAAALARDTDTDHAPRPLPSYPVLQIPKAALRERIERRLEIMYAQGWVDEVRRLKKECPAMSRTASMAIGYAEIGQALTDGTDPGLEKPKILSRTLRLAKHQATWFRHQAVPLEVAAASDPGLTARAVEDAWRQHGPWQIRIPVP